MRFLKKYIYIQRHLTISYPAAQSYHPTEYKLGMREWDNTLSANSATFRRKVQ